VSSAALPSGSDEHSVLGTSSSAERSSPVLTRALRDELVRTALPEIRQLVRYMVDSVVEEAIAPLREKQQELEAALKELRTVQSRSERSPGAAPARAVDVATPPGISQVEPRAAVPVSTQSGQVAAAIPRADVQPMPGKDWSTVADIPAELDGSRRKRTIAWSLGVLMLLAVLCVAGLSVLSNMGIRI
jgi:hypothetical protein